MVELERIGFLHWRSGSLFLKTHISMLKICRCKQRKSISCYFGLQWSWTDVLGCQNISRTDPPVCIYAEWPRVGPDCKLFVGVTKDRNLPFGAIFSSNPPSRSKGAGGTDAAAPIALVVRGEAASALFQKTFHLYPLRPLHLKLSSDCFSKWTLLLSWGGFRFIEGGWV